MSSNAEQPGMASGGRPLRQTMPLPSSPFDPAGGARAPYIQAPVRVSGLAIASLVCALLGAAPLALGALQSLLLSHGIVLVTAEDLGFSFDPGPAMLVFYGAWVVGLGFPTLAAIFGQVARGRIKRARGRLKGDRYAVAALIIAYLQLIIVLPFAILFALFFLGVG